MLFVVFYVIKYTAAVIESGCRRYSSSRFFYKRTSFFSYFAKLYNTNNKSVESKKISSSVCFACGLLVIRDAGYHQYRSKEIPAFVNSGSLAEK